MQLTQMVSRDVFFLLATKTIGHNLLFHQKLNGTESQRTPKEVTRAMRYSGLGVRSLGPVGDFLDDLLSFAILCILPKCKINKQTTTHAALTKKRTQNPKKFNERISITTFHVQCLH